MKTIRTTLLGIQNTHLTLGFFICIFPIFLSSLLSESQAMPIPPDLETVPYVDLDRYLGEWFEIAAFPQRFEKDCFGSKAHYTKDDNATIRVENSCFKGSLDGPSKKVTGTAYVADPTTNAKLKVSFFWPFYGDYWIIALDPDYKYAMIGAPDRKYLWILSRSKTLSPETYEQLLSEANDLGFDTSKIKLMPQPQN